MSVFDIEFRPRNTEGEDFIEKMERDKKKNNVRQTVITDGSILDDFSVARRRHMNSVIPVGGNSDVRHIFRVSRQKSGVRRW